MSARAQVLPISDQLPAPPQDAATHDTTGRDQMIANSMPSLPARPVSGSDPLGVIKAMSEEEKIALFT
jgi:hypothetical protein